MSTFVHEHRPLGGPLHLDPGPPSSTFIVERPVAAGLPEVIRILDDEEVNGYPALLHIPDDNVIFVGFLRPPGFEFGFEGQHSSEDELEEDISSSESSLSSFDLSGYSTADSNSSSGFHEEEDDDEDQLLPPPGCDPWFPFGFSLLPDDPALREE